MTDKQDNNHQLGTFLGVFTPSILTILGVIMYLRFGWVVGQAGLWRTLVIVLIANGITLITSLSVAALATNTKVGVGGNYFLMSRSLGLEIGGALGLPLFLSQALSMTLYCYGLAESLRFVFSELNIHYFTLIVLVLITLLSAKSAKLALKLQLPLMLFVFLSIGLLIAGAKWGTPTHDAWNVQRGYPGFWVVFAVFFPAVTGVTTGVGMSGDLKDPARSIPMGILSAVLVGFVIYMLIPVILATNAKPEHLISDSLIWTRIAKYPYLIFPGLWGAILSSAIGSALAAPRTLQALAMDRIVPKFFARTSSNGEPINALGVTFVIASLAILLGNLNNVAVVVTIFFLTSYGMLNLGAGMEAVIGDPSFRPRWRIPWYVSFLGFIGCLWTMFLISPAACIIAFFIEIIIWVYLRRRALTATWGDIWHGFYQSIIRYSLFKMKELPRKPRDWRPNILIYVGDITKRLDLVRFATWFGQNRGIVTVCDLIVRPDLDVPRELIQSHFMRLEEVIREMGMLAFSQVNVVSDFKQGVVDVAQANGIAGLSSNTILMGWSHDLDGLALQLQIMRELDKFQKSFILCKFKSRRIYQRAQRMVIWWGGLERNGDLMLLLAHLLSLNPEWSSAKIILKSLANDTEMLANTKSYLAELIPEIRINVTAEVLLRPSDKSLEQMIQDESRDAEIVFLGLAIPEVGNELQYARRISALAADLPTVFFVRNATMHQGNLI